MSLDDLMEVWRSQDAVPMHGVNETLLRLALRQDEAKLRAQRRTEEWITYLMSAFFIAIMAIFALMMFYNDDDVITGWDFAIPIIGVVASALMSVALYMTHRAQALREQHFGESLRDQLGRRLAQLDYQATRAVRLTIVLLIAIFVGATAILLAGMRVNAEPNEPFDGWESVVGGILVSAFGSVAGVSAARQSVKRDVLPRKQRLEALLKDLDGQ